MKKLIKLCLDERITMAAIGLSAIVIFVLSFSSFMENRMLLILDNLFIVFFTIEAYAKISTYGWKKYISDNWNRFDFVLVLLSLPNLIVWFQKFGIELPLAELMSNIIILRLFRLLRIFRLVSFLPNMSKMLMGISRALKASTFVLLVLFVFNIILAIFTCHLYRETLPEYFGDPFLSSYTIFQLFTVEGWYEIPSAIAERTDNDMVIGFSKLYFILIVLLGGVFGMSLANAIFVDEMTSDNNEEVEKKLDVLQSELEEIKSLLRKRE